MTPPICTTLWREYPASTATPEPLVVDGHVIPPGTEIGVNIYTLHHNAKYFSEPWTFKPERWLHGDEAQKKRMYDAFTPFSVGARGCGGKAMAYAETSLVLAKTLWYLDFGRPDTARLDHVGESMSGLSGAKAEFGVRDQFSSVHEGPNLVFKIREGVGRGDLEVLEMMVE